MNAATVDTLDAALLPAEFADLAGFCDWALPTDTARSLKRAATPMEELRRVYTALLPRVEAMMLHLDQFPYGAPLPAPEQRLFHLALALMNISHPVELGWAKGYNPEGFDLARVHLPERV